MNKTVMIVKEWVDFEAHNPEGSLEDFCKYFLSAKEKSQSMGIEVHCSSDYQLIYSLTKTINRLSRLWMYFTLNAMKPTGLSSFDEFAFLYTINQSTSIRKKDLIYTNLIEISSGLLVIDRLMKKGLLTEKVDELDKRSKQVSLTQKGKETLEACHLLLGKVAQDLYGDMPDEEMELCINYLLPLEKRIAEKWHQLKKFEPVIS